MIQLIRQELHKILVQKVIYIASLIFLVLYGVQFIQEMGAHSNRQQVQAMFRQYGGSLTEEKVAWAQRVMVLDKQVNQRTGETSRKTRPAPPTDPELRLQTQVAARFLNAEQLAKGREQASAHGQADEAAALGQHTERLIKPDYIGYHHGWQRILQFMGEAGCFFIGALVILGVSGSYSQEATSRMDNLLLSSRHGRSRLAVAKLTAAALYCAGIVALFNGCAFLFNGIGFGWAGGTMKLVNVVDIYGNTSFGGAVWQFYALQMLYATMGSIVLALLVLLFSSFTRFALLPAVTGGLVYLLPFVAGLVHLPGANIMQWLLRYFDLIQLASLDSAFCEFTVLGSPIYYAAEPLMGIVIYLALTGLLLAWNVKRRQVVAG